MKTEQNQTIVASVYYLFNLFVESFLVLAEILGDFYETLVLRGTSVEKRCSNLFLIELLSENKPILVNELM